MHERLTRAHGALKASTYPKLLFAGEHGALVSPAYAESFEGELANCDVVHLGPGRHYLQEDHPQAIGQAVAIWIARHSARSEGEAA